MSKQITNDPMADVIGLAVLAMLISLMSLFVPHSEVPGVFWIFIYLAWGACSLFVWRHQRAPKSGKQWILLAVISVIGAPLWYGMAFLIARLIFGSAESELSKTFDILVTLILAPGLTFVAICGWVRMEVSKRWPRST